VPTDLSSQKVIYYEKADDDIFYTKGGPEKSTDYDDTPFLEVVKSRMAELLAGDVSYPVQNALSQLGYVLYSKYIGKPETLEYGVQNRKKVNSVEDIFINHDNMKIPDDVDPYMDLIEPPLRAIQETLASGTSMTLSKGKILKIIERVNSNESSFPSNKLLNVLIAQGYLAIRTSYNGDRYSVTSRGYAFLRGEDQ
jgi:predicted transcriptional regulator